MSLQVSHRTKNYDHFSNFKMTNSNLNMQSLEDNKTIALNVKDIEQDTLAMDEDGKNDSKGTMYTDFKNMDSSCNLFQLR